MLFISALCRYMFKSLIILFQHKCLLYGEFSASVWPSGNWNCLTVSILNSVAFHTKMTSSKLLIGDGPWPPTPYLCLGVAQWRSSASVQTCIMKCSNNKENIRIYWQCHIKKLFFTFISHEQILFAEILVEDHLSCCYNSYFLGWSICLLMFVLGKPRLTICFA